MRKTLFQISKRFLSIVLVISCIGMIIAHSMMAEASEITYETLALSDKGSMTCSEVGVSSPHDLWYMSLGGKQVFCLTPGGHARTGDVYKVTPTNPMTYKYNGSLEKGHDFARAFAYWSKLDYSIKNHQAMQAYIWAVAKGKDKVNSVQQATSWNFETAKNFVTAIDKTPIFGTLYVCTISKCSHGKSSKSQILMRWTSEDAVVPQYDTIQLSDSKTNEVPFELIISKKDFETSAFIDTAKFEVYRDNILLKKSDVKEINSGSYQDGTWSTKNGSVSFNFIKTYATGVIKSEKYSYVTNWTQLNEVQQKEALKKGYFSNKADATSVAKQDLKQKIEAKMTSLMSESHAWEIVEVESPDGYSISTDPSITFTENATMKSYTATFDNSPQRGYIEIYKENSLDVTNCGFEKSGQEVLDANKTTNFLGATYEITAATQITDTYDNVIYQKGDVVEELSLGNLTIAEGKKVGYAKSGVLYEGTYFVKETKAPIGFTLNPRSYSVTIHILDNETEVIKAVYTGDEECYGFTAEKITRDYEMVELGGRKKLSITDKKEANATFDLYYLNGSDWVKIKTYITDSEGKFSQESGLIPGKYKLEQTIGTIGYEYISPIEFEIVKGKAQVELGTLVNDGVIPPYGFIEVQKKYVLVDPENVTSVIEYGWEEGAEFEVYNSQHELVDTFQTDAKGYGISDALEPGTYTLKQISGKSGYELISDKDGIVLVEGTIVNHALENYSYGTKIKIQKSTTAKNGFSHAQPEANAQFCVIDKQKALQAGISLDVVPESVYEKNQLVKSLERADAVLGTIITDNTGTGSIVLEGEITDFCLMQTRGTAGYDMISEFLRAEDGVKTQGQGIIFTYNLKNPKTDYGYGYVALHKLMTYSESVAVPEESAVFQILDISSKEVLQTLVTDKNGYVKSERLEAGKYILHQVSGFDEYHAFVKDSVITIKENDKGVTYYATSSNYIIKANANSVSYAKKPLSNGSTYLDVSYSTSKSYLVNPEELIKLKLTKYNSDDINHVLIGAQYSFYDANGKEILDEEGNGTAFITDEKGEAEIYLNYGTYYIREKYAPDGFTRNTALMKLEVTVDGVKISVHEKGTSELTYVDMEVVSEGLSSNYTSEKIEEMKTECDTLKVSMEIAKTEMERTYKEFLVLYEKDDTSNIAELTELYDSAMKMYYDALYDYNLANDNYTKAQSSGETTAEEVKILEKVKEDAYVTFTNAETEKNVAYHNLKTANSDIATAQQVYQEKSNGYLLSQIAYANVVNEYQKATMSSSFTICYNLTDKDSPIYASLLLNKTGDSLVGTKESEEGMVFVYEEMPLEGAIYALYAAEDIMSGDERILYHKKGDLVASGTTDKNGQIQFKREQNGIMTEKLYLGSYYYMETSAPYGYALDDTKHYVELVDSTLAELLGEPDIGAGIPMTEETEHKDMVMASYELGEGIIAKLFTTGILEISGDGTAPVFASQDVVPWYADGNYLKIQSVVAGQEVTFSKLDYYFTDCSELVAFEVKNEKAFANLTSMKKAFYGCYALNIVPSFANSTKLTDISYAFMKCYLLDMPPSFLGCHAITITDYAFAHCYSLPDKADIPMETTTTYQECTNIYLK